MFHDKLLMPLPALVTPAVIAFIARTPALRKSDRKVAVAQNPIGGERPRTALPHDASLLHNVMTVAQTQQGVDILVNHEDRQAVTLEGLKPLPNLLADQRRQSLSGLIQHQ